MNQYELALVVNAKIEEEERKKVVDSIQEMIVKFGGTVTKLEESGKKKLAYEIQKMKEGFYYFIQFDANATCPREIEQRVRIMEPVIRYLCVRQDA